MSQNFTFVTVGCGELNSTLYDTNNSTFSRAPGTELVISCTLSNKIKFLITCQEDGRWEPDPNNEMDFCRPGIFTCPVVPYHIVPGVYYFLGLAIDRTEQTARVLEWSTTKITESNHVMNETQITLLVSVSAIIVATCLSLILCTLVGVIIIYIKRNTEDENDTYNENVDPIYETVGDAGDDEVKTITNNEVHIEMSHNDAYANSDCALKISPKINSAYGLHWGDSSLIQPIKRKDSYLITDSSLHDGTDIKQANLCKYGVSKAQDTALSIGTQVSEFHAENCMQMTISLDYGGRFVPQDPALLCTETSNLTP